jgi:activator of HSP90 ATPase
VKSLSLAMSQSFELKEVFKVSPAIIYHAWLDSQGHSDMTGGEANCSDMEGGSFTAWDEYITGANRSLKKNQEIVQYWRTSEFPDGAPDSVLTIKLKATGDGCELSLIHSNIPDGQSDYETGWIEHYFNPMHEYFGG